MASLRLAYGDGEMGIGPTPHVVACGAQGRLGGDALHY